MQSLLPLLAFLTALPALAVDRPRLPAREQDRAALANQTAEAFFPPRERDAACQTSLAAALGAWRAQPTSLANQRRLLPLVQRCGRCVLADVEHRPRPGAGGTENWYISSGRCQLSGTADERRAKVARLVSLLSTVRSYPQRNGGYPDVVEFRRVDGDGNVLPEVETPEASPFLAFVAVRGPLNFAPSYFVRNVFEARAERFWLEFNTVREPDGFQPPAMPFTAMPLPQAMGQWYLEPSGYVRYFTAGDFPGGNFLAGLTRELAQRILLNTLLRALDRTEERR